MASRKTRHEETIASDAEKKPLVCVVHSHGSAGRSFVYFCCQRPEYRLEKLQYICRWRPMKPADSPNRMEDSFNQVREELVPEMVIIQTVTSALPKILIAWNLPQRIQKQYSNLELLGVLRKLLRKWFWNLTVSSVINRDERRSKRKMFGQLKLLQCLNVKVS